MNEQEFPQGSVPVAVAARVYGKDASWVRAGIVSGWLPIGKATRSGKLVTTIEEMDSRYGRINFYISPKRLYEETGFLWKGERQYYDALVDAAATDISKYGDFEWFVSEDPYVSDTPPWFSPGEPHEEDSTPFDVR